MATGISVVMLCPGPTFSNLLAVAATEKPGEVKKNLNIISKLFCEILVFLTHYTHSI